MKFLFLMSVLLAGSNPAVSQSADDIIAKHFAATGGAERWARVTSIKYTGHYVMGPGMLAPVVGISISKPFSGYYGEFSWQGMTSKSCLRADSGWTYNPFGGKRETDPMNPIEVRQNKLEADPQGLLYNYRQKGYTADYLGTDDMDGTDVHKLRLTTREGDMIYYYIDAETFYVLKAAKRFRLKEKEEKSYTTYSDFRKTDFGIVVPYAQQNVDENGNEQGGPVVYTKVEVNSPLDLSVFDKAKQ